MLLPHMVAIPLEDMVDMVDIQDMVVVIQDIIDLFINFKELLYLKSHVRFFVERLYVQPSIGIEKHKIMVLKQMYLNLNSD